MPWQFTCTLKCIYKLRSLLQDQDFTCVYIYIQTTYNTMMHNTRLWTLTRLKFQPPLSSSRNCSHELSSAKNCGYSKDAEDYVSNRVAIKMQWNISIAVHNQSPCPIKLFEISIYSQGTINYEWKRICQTNMDTYFGLAVKSVTILCRHL